MKPQLVEKKILKKIFKKRKGNSKYFNKGLRSVKKILFSNWYIILILGLISFLLFLRFKDTINKKTNENLTNIEKDDDEKEYETLANSDSYESDYYSMIQKVRPVGADHPSLNNQININY